MTIRPVRLAHRWAVSALGQYRTGAIIRPLCLYRAIFAGVVQCHPYLGEIRLVMILSLS